jgi:hypothetical protein
MALKKTKTKTPKKKKTTKKQEWEQSLLAP